MQTGSRRKPLPPSGQSKCKSGLRRASAASALLLAALLGASLPAAAEPAFARYYKNSYGYMPSCNACHRDGGGSPVNAYGQAFGDAGKSLAALTRIAELDSDGDGTANGAEAAAKANPGSAASTPAAPGDWLDTRNLIPREVQAAFPGVTRYKPLDAIFTEVEIERAAALGVSLAAQDENTIYVPIADKRAVGTAIIVPAPLADEQRLHVLVATDRQLKITTVRPIHAEAIDGAGAAELYTPYIGYAVDNLPKVTSTAPLARPVADAVRKAGAMIYVRLKKSS